VDGDGAFSSRRRTGEGSVTQKQFKIQKAKDKFQKAKSKADALTEVIPRAAGFYFCLLPFAICLLTCCIFDCG
jgi:hypothetical protein